MDTRLNKDEYYMNIAKSISERSNCLRKHWGAVIVNNDEIVSTGYNGSPRRTVNCCDVGECFRIKHNIPRGTRYEVCRAVHAEQNAIISAARKDMIGGVLYLYGFDVETNNIVENSNICMICKRMIINAEIVQVVLLDSYNDDGTMKLKYIDVNFEWVMNDDVLYDLKGY